MENSLASGWQTEISILSTSWFSIGKMTGDFWGWTHHYPPDHVKNYIGVKWNVLLSDKIRL